MLPRSVLATPAMVCLVVLSDLWAPARVLAWTEAQVQSAHARVEVQASGEVKVHMRLAVHVQGGWLEGLDIAGLDPELTLDPAQQIVLVSADGQQFFPAVDASQPGTIGLAFRRRDAPRRGEYALELAYRAVLAPGAVQPLEGERSRYEWILPGWRSGLDDVRVEVIAPASAELDDELRVGETMITREREVLPDGRVLFRFVRAHLPRTVPFQVAFTLPNTLVPAELRAASVSTPLSPMSWTATPSRRMDPVFPVLCFFMALFGAAKLALHRRTALSLGVTPRGLLPLPPLVRAGAVVALSAASAWLYHLRTDAGLAALGVVVLFVLERAPQVERPPRLGAYAPAGPRERLWAGARAKLGRYGAERWLDASSVPGLLTLLGVVLALVAVDRVANASLPRQTPPGYATILHALVPFVCLMLSTTRAQLPATVAERLCDLVALARTFPVSVASVPTALQLVLHRDAQGRGQDARLRIVTAHRVTGLVRLDVAIADYLRLGRYVREPVVLVVTREESEAEARVALALGDLPFRSAPGGRRARTLPLHRLGVVVDAVATERATQVLRADGVRPPRRSVTERAATRA
ncbi:MAG: hypothetical protein IPL19_00330 [Sandaracinaceae bacterium]|nr:hypothetical protein [Sandaracinaceae bacterium]MBK8406404.1 hypothetical protein [Sandaracinaceae bacterium]MBP7682386.1 hypothetical protein [Deltaproteobacteria bacterium]